jgi:hypothetical protein
MPATVETVDLHDARIHRGHVDHETGCVTLSIAYRENPASHKLTQASLVFEGVRSLPIVADLLARYANPKAGNVISWTPSPQSGNTFIYMLDGVISIWAERLTLQEGRS